MNQSDEFDPLDPILHEYFSGQLEAQSGRALTRFVRESAAIRQAPLRRSPRARRWVIGAASLTTAAALLLLAWNFARQRGAQNEPPRPAPAPAALANQPKHQSRLVASQSAPLAGPSKAVQAPTNLSEPPVKAQSPALDQRPLLVERATRWRTIDEGTVLIGQTAVRKVRRQWWERVEWFDPEHGARVQRLVPREELSFIAIPVN